MTKSSGAVGVLAVTGDALSSRLSGDPVRPPDSPRRAAMRRFWLERFTDAEIVAMAGAFQILLGDRSKPAAVRERRDHLKQAA